MIYTKMMDSLNEEETPQEQVVPQEHPAEIEEISVDDIESLNAYDREQVELSAEIALKSMEFDKKFSMMSHVAKFGVDRSFLSICNSNNELATELGITLPATEDFEIYGDPNSNTSKKVISSMEAFLDFGKKESLWTKFWKWIKEIVGKILGWIKGFFTKVWEFIKKLLGLGKAKLDKIEEIANQLKKAGIKTVDVNDDFARLGQDLQRGFIERQDRLIRSRQRVATVKEIANTSLKIIKDLVKTRGEWVPARVQELEATTGKLKDWVSNTWGAVKGVTGAVTDTIGNTWDFLHDFTHSNENNARRYAQKTVVAQRRREYLDAAKRRGDPLDDWMAHTYDVQGGTGRHTRNTVFDNTDPWSYRNNGPQSSAAQPASSARQAQNNANPAPQQRNQGSSGAAASSQQRNQGSQVPPRQQAAQGNNQPQQTTSMSVENLIRNHVEQVRDRVVQAGGESAQCQDLVTELTGIYNDLRTLQSQVSNSNATTEHAAIVQANVQALIDTVDRIRQDLQAHSTEQGAALANANRIAETQLVNLVYGFQNQMSILGLVIFDRVNSTQNNFSVTSSEIRNVDYSIFRTRQITNANNQQNYRIDEVWVRPERAARVGNVDIGRPGVWGVSIPAASGVNMAANRPSAVLTCELPGRTIADMWRGYRQQATIHGGYWDAAVLPTTINVRLYIPLDDPGFVSAINTAHTNNVTTMTYEFTSLVPAVDLAATGHDHTHMITIGGNELSALYTRIRTAARSNQALAQLYSNLLNP